MIQRKNAKAEANTYGSHICMIDPRLEDERTNSIYNNNRIMILFFHGISVYVGANVIQWGHTNIDCLDSHRP